MLAIIVPIAVILVLVGIFLLIKSKESNVGLSHKPLSIYNEDVMARRNLAARGLLKGGKKLVKRNKKTKKYPKH